jgi:AcrR family transcriptional regulator
MTQPPPPSAGEHPVEPGGTTLEVDRSLLLVREPVQDRSRRSLERLVAAAARLLEAHGPDAVTVTGVAKEARISVGAFYARFSGKEEMVRYLGERWLSDAIEQWTSASRELSSGPRRGLTALAALYLDGPARRLALLHGQDDPAPSRLRRFEDRVAGDLSSPGVPAADGGGEDHSDATRFLRALAVVAGVRELGARASEGTGRSAGLGPGALAEIMVGLSKGLELPATSRKGGWEESAQESEEGGQKSEEPGPEVEEQEPVRESESASVGSDASWRGDEVGSAAPWDTAHHGESGYEAGVETEPERNPEREPQQEAEPEPKLEPELEPEPEGEPRQEAEPAPDPDAGTPPGTRPTKEPDVFDVWG